MDANTVTFLAGANLAEFLNDFPGGFSPNAVFMDASATGSTTFGNFVFVDAPASPTPSPEPSTLSLLALGLLGLGAIVRRQRAVV